MVIARAKRLVMTMSLVVALTLEVVYVMRKVDSEERRTRKLENKISSGNNGHFNICKFEFG